MGHALWQFTAEGWVIEKDASVEGAKPSAPPAQPGLFVGQIRATPSVPATQAV